MFKDYAPKLAYFFPGQGAQTVGMAKVGYTTADTGNLECLDLQSSNCWHMKHAVPAH